MGREDIAAWVVDIAMGSASHRTLKDLSRVTDHYKICRRSNGNSKAIGGYFWQHRLGRDRSLSDFCGRSLP